MILGKQTKSLWIKTVLILSLVMLMPSGAGGSDPAQESTGCFDRDDLEKYDVDERRQILFRSKPIINSFWTEAPDIRLCRESGVTESRARQAVRYWERLGYEFGELIVERQGSQRCSGEGLTGEITILLPTSETPLGQNLAMTRNMILTESRIMLKSLIHIMPYSASKPLVLEHEIGHALGWRHYNRSYHIMHSTYTRVGHTSTGVAYREYQSEIFRISPQPSFSEDQSVNP